MTTPTPTPTLEISFALDKLDMPMMAGATGALESIGFDVERIRGMVFEDERGEEERHGKESDFPA